MRPATPLASPEPPVGPGRHHALLQQHLTNMTAMQRQVCKFAIDEYNELVARAAMLEVENNALVRQVADMVLAKSSTNITIEPIAIAIPNEPKSKAARRARANPARVNGNGAHR